TAVFNNHRDDAFTARDGGGQPETGARIAGAIDSGCTFPGLFAINPGTDRHFGSRRNTTFGPFDMQIGGDHVPGAITIAYKSDLAVIGGMASRAQKNASNVKPFATAVDRFIRRDVHKVALDAAELGGNLWRRGERPRLTAKHESGSNEEAADGHGGNALKQMI